MQVDPIPGKSTFVKNFLLFKKTMSLENQPSMQIFYHSRRPSTWKSIFDIDRFII